MADLFENPMGLNGFEFVGNQIQCRIPIGGFVLIIAMITDLWLSTTTRYLK